MADPATFGHDRLGHLLADRLLDVPKFQRKFSWDVDNVADYVKDLQGARARGDSYFMGTIVLASGETAESPDLIVDGQQRIITTALLLIAVRDRLREHAKDDAARSVQSEHLSNYVLEQEQTVERMTVGPSDLECYRGLLAGEDRSFDKSAMAVAYRALKAHTEELAPTPEDYRALIELVTFLDNQVQVLVAVATGLAEAYVIFETLNDRGADLTTADLLKNYLFSRAGAAITAAENAWARISSAFEEPDDLVKYLRYEYMSRYEPVTRRGLYKAIQNDIGDSSAGVSRYLSRIERSLATYLAVRDPDALSWSSESIEVRDSLLAFRRFGFESSMPLLLAAFEKWKHPAATKFVEVVAAWSVRAWFAGTLGGGQAESAFSRAARAVTDGDATSPEEVRPFVADLVPDDPAFSQAIRGYGAMQTTRAKYLLAMLERQFLANRGENTDSLPDWSSKSVTIEHLFAKSMKVTDFTDLDDFSQFQVLRDQLANYALLERTLNNGLEDKPFVDKRETYGQSRFALTRELAEPEGSDWTFEDADTRLDQLVVLAIQAWPK